MSPALRLLALLLLLPLSAFAQTLTPSGDAHVRGGSAANNNYGGVVLLGVRTANNALNTYWSYIKFSTSGVSGQVSSAKLRVFTALSSNGSVQTNLYAVPATWGETTITWNNKPALGTQLGSFTVNTTGYVWKEIDVTAHVQAQLAQGAVGFALANPSQSSQLTGIQARESSNPAQLVITTNSAPTVSLTSPANNTSFTAPANIAVAATAADSDGTITSVEFFHGTTSITTLTSAPYSFTWTGVPQGAYVLTAKATDNLGATTTSAPVSITVQASVAQLHFIHVDHLNTPRLVANQAGQTVWRWDQAEPFGNNPADENPSGLGTFDLPLRLPGQYFDKETNLHYNYFRDYDPGIGRYVESDPIGLRSGLNTYAYVSSNPLMYIDVDGLKVRLICRPLGLGIAGAVFDHCFVHVTCPSEGIDKTLSFYGTFPYLWSSGHKRQATPQTYKEQPGYPDNPNIKNKYDEEISTCGNTCCAYEKEVIGRFDKVPNSIPYELTGFNSNSFSRYLIDSPRFCAGVPSNAPTSAPGLR